MMPFQNPNPAHSIEHASLESGMRITIRPIRPDDDEMVRAFLRGLSRASTSNRLLSGRNLTPAEIDHLTHIDYEKEMAFVAVTSVDGHESEIGVARYVRDDDRTSAEFALLIADAWQRQGVGTLLLSTLLRHARSAGIVRIHGTTYSINKAMIDLARKLGFAVISVPSDATILELAISLARDDCAPVKGGQRTNAEHDV